MEFNFKNSFRRPSESCDLKGSHPSRVGYTQVLDRAPTRNIVRESNARTTMKKARAAQAEGGRSKSTGVADDERGARMREKRKERVRLRGGVRCRVFRRAGPRSMRRSVRSGCKKRGTGCSVGIVVVVRWCRLGGILTKWWIRQLTRKGLS